MTLNSITAMTNRKSEKPALHRKNTLSYSRLTTYQVLHFNFESKWCPKLAGVAFFSIANSGNSETIESGAPL
jgi:hypothetical protein